MVRPVFFSAYVTCWYELLFLFGADHFFSHFRASFLFLLIYTVINHSDTIKTTDYIFQTRDFMHQLITPFR